MPRPARVVKHGSGQRDRVGLIVGDDALGLFGLGNQADRYRRKPNLGLHALCVRHLIARPQLDRLQRRDAARRDVNRRAATGLQCLRKGDRPFDVPSVGNPVCGGYPHPHRFFRRKRCPHRIEHFERKSHPVLEAAPVFVGTAISDRREELVKQIAMRPVDLDTFESDSASPASGRREVITYARKSCFIERERDIFVLRMRDRGRSLSLPTERIGRRDLGSSFPRSPA
jgi:hypothetical protein